MRFSNQKIKEDILNALIIGCYILKEQKSTQVPFLSILSVESHKKLSLKNVYWQLQTKVVRTCLELLLFIFACFNEEWIRTADLWFGNRPLCLNFLLTTHVASRCNIYLTVNYFVMMNWSRKTFYNFHPLVCYLFIYLLFRTKIFNFVVIQFSLSLTLEDLDPTF